MYCSIISLGFSFPCCRSGAHGACVLSAVDLEIEPRCKIGPTGRFLAECRLHDPKLSLCLREPAPRFEALRTRQKIMNTLLLQIQNVPAVNVMHRCTILSAGQRHPGHINRFSTIAVQQPPTTTIIHGNLTNRM